jgi:hypothetical protein
MRGDEVIGETVWSLSGEHNRANAAAALLAARHVGVPFDKGLDALSRFENVKRRMELRGVVNESGLRRFRASPDGDCDDGRRAAAQDRLRCGVGFWPCSNRARTP